MLPLTSIASIIADRSTGVRSGTVGLARATTIAAHATSRSAAGTCRLIRRRRSIAAAATSVDGKEMAWRDRRRSSQR
jgi:hypothetical protein